MHISRILHQMHISLRQWNNISFHSGDSSPSLKTSQLSVVLAQLPSLIFFLSSSGFESLLWCLVLECLSKYFAIFIITFKITTSIPKRICKITPSRLNQTNIILLLEKLHVAESTLVLRKKIFSYLNIDFFLAYLYSYVSQIQRTSYTETFVPIPNKIHPDPQMLRNIIYQRINSKL